MTDIELINEEITRRAEENVKIILTESGILESLKMHPSCDCGVGLCGCDESSEVHCPMCGKDADPEEI